MTNQSENANSSTLGTPREPVSGWFVLAMNSPLVRDSRSETLKLTVNTLDFIFHHQDEVLPDEDGVCCVEDLELGQALGVLAPHVRCSLRTMAKHLRTLERAGLLERTGSCFPFGFYMLRFPPHEKPSQTAAADLDVRELQDIQRYLFDLKNIRKARVFSDRGGLPISTASTLSAVHLGARTVADIGLMTGMTAATTRRHLGILASHGLVTFDPADGEQVEPAWGAEIHTALSHLFTPARGREGGRP